MCINQEDYMNMLKKIGIIAITAMIVFSLVGCGGSSSDPKSLAKEALDLTKDAMAAILNPSKASSVQKKWEAHYDKVEKLSDADKEIYEAELLRLAGNALGGLGGLWLNLTLRRR